MGSERAVLDLFWRRTLLLSSVRVERFLGTVRTRCGVSGGCVKIGFEAPIAQRIEQPPPKR